MSPGARGARRPGDGALPLLREARRSGRAGHGEEPSVYGPVARERQHLRNRIPGPGGPAQSPQLPARS